MCMSLNYEDTAWGIGSMRPKGAVRCGL